MSRSPTRGVRERMKAFLRPGPEQGNEAPMVITPRAVVDLSRQLVRQLRRSRGRKG